MKCPFLLLCYLHPDQCHLLAVAPLPVGIHTEQEGETACAANPIFAGVGAFCRKVFLVSVQVLIFFVVIHLLEGVAE